MEEEKQKKVFVSIPMRGKANHEIERAMAFASRRLEAMGYTVLNNYVQTNIVYDILSQKEVKPPSLYFLGEAIQDMSFADAVYFCKGWDKAPGCLVEHMAAEQYGKEILYEEEGL